MKTFYYIYIYIDIMTEIEDTYIEEGTLVGDWKENFSNIIGIDNDRVTYMGLTHEGQEYPIGRGGGLVIHLSIQIDPNTDTDFHKLIEDHYEELYQHYNYLYVLL